MKTKTAIILAVIAIIVAVVIIITCMYYFLPREPFHSMEKSFTDIYHGKLFGSDHPNGAGSMDENTVRDREVLSAVIQKYNIHSMLDAPCGLFTWMKLVLSPFPTIRYSGMDIVKDQVDTNQNNYPLYQFIHGDISTHKLGKHDLIFSKEGTQHLKENTTLGFLQNVVDSGSTYLLITSYDVPENSDKNVDKDAPLQQLDAGGYREQNMLLPPYSYYLKKPLERFWIRKNPFTKTDQYLQLFQLR